MKHLVAIIPAHNEQDTIEQVICDLLVQTRRPDRIIVVADNCTDNTVHVAQSFIQNWPCEVFVTENNKARKAGAINQALETLGDQVDYVLLMDADTSLDSHAIEVALEYMQSHQDTAAVCSRAGVQPLDYGSSVWQWLLHRLQRIEYAMFDSQRVETLDSIKVVHGMAALHRFAALRQVGFYREDNLVEDYELTLRYREAGWKVTTDLSIQAWTVVPTNLPELWRQRVRWLRGGVDTLREHGWNTTTRKDILSHFLGVPLVMGRVGVSGLFAWSLLQDHESLLFHPIAIVYLGMSLVDMSYRMKYLDQPRLIDWLVRFSLVPEAWYSWFQTIALVWSYILSFLNIRQEW